MNSNPDFDQLLSALMYMLTRQARDPTTALVGPIRDHLNWLITHPDAQTLPLVRKTLCALSRHWERQDVPTSLNGAVVSQAGNTRVH